MDYYNGNPRIKRDGVKEEWTKEKIEEYAHCMKDPVYFISRYVKIISLDKGLVTFSPYTYQKEFIEHCAIHRFVVALMPRQVGKSITVLAYILWYIIFNPERSYGILANKGAIAREMLGRLTLMLENLPFFLQPGCRVVNKGSIEFSNNSRVLAAATSSSSLRGMSLSGLLLDEFAFVERAEEFYTSTYPIISSGTNTQIIITSTPNGIGNVFHKIWEGAVQKTNSYQPFSIHWSDVPGRDEKWKQETIANTSEQQFRQEHGIEFLGSGNTLIEANTLLGLMSIDPIWKNETVKIYKKPELKHDYIMTVDVAKGRGQDYSTFNIIDITAQPFEQVCVFRDNRISPSLLPDVINKYAILYNNAYVIIESNDMGAMVVRDLYHNLEYENVHVQSSIKQAGLGVYMDKRVKRIGCNQLKDLIEEHKLILHDSATILELSSFEFSGVSWSASDNNHDDLVMNFVLFAWFTTNSFFSNISNIDIKQMIHDENMKDIENDVPPFGEIYNPADTTVYDDLELERTNWL